MENFWGPRCRRGAHGAPAPPVVNVGAAPCGRPRAAEGGGPYRQQQPGISVGRVWCAQSLPPSFASQMPPPSSEGGFFAGFTPPYTPGTPRLVGRFHTFIGNRAVLRLFSREKAAVLFLFPIFLRILSESLTGRPFDTGGWGW